MAENDLVRPEFNNSLNLGLSFYAIDLSLQHHYFVLEFNSTSGDRTHLSYKPHFNSTDVLVTTLIIEVNFHLYGLLRGVSVFVHGDINLLFTKIEEKVLYVSFLLEGHIEVHFLHRFIVD
jgi:hypothetical protein